MKMSRKLMIANRVSQLKRRIRADTQKVRRNAIHRLEELFNLAVSLAKGEFDTQTVDGETVKVTMKQRQLWARVAAYIAQIMNNIAEGFDEKEIDMELDELERLVAETRSKAGTIESKDAKKILPNLICKTDLIFHSSLIQTEQPIVARISQSDPKERIRNVFLLQNSGKEL